MKQYFPDYVWDLIGVLVVFGLWFPSLIEIQRVYRGCIYVSIIVFIFTIISIQLSLYVLFRKVSYYIIQIKPTPENNTPVSTELQEKWKGL